MPAHWTCGVQVYAAGIENVVNAWDLRKGEITMTLAGHSDTVTSIAVSPDGSHLLSNSMVGPAKDLLPCCFSTPSAASIQNEQTNMPASTTVILESRSLSTGGVTGSAAKGMQHGRDQAAAAEFLPMPALKCLLAQLMACAEPAAVCVCQICNLIVQYLSSKQDQPTRCGRLLDNFPQTGT